MDGAPNVENSLGTRTSKHVLLISVAVIVGAFLGAGALYYYYISKNAVFFVAPPTANTSTLSFPNSTDLNQKVPDLSQHINIIFPKTLVGQDYYILINKIENELKQVGADNISKLVPLMDSIKEKSAAHDYTSFFDLVGQAKAEIQRESSMLATTRQDITALKQVNLSTKDADVRKQTDVLLAATDTFVQAFSDYFSVLNETLSGSIPTQDLLNKLTQQITTLQNAGVSVKAELDALLTLVKQKSPTSPIKP